MLGSAAGNPQNIRTKFFELKNLILLGEDQKLSHFFDYLENKFPDLLNISELQKQNMASNRKVSKTK
jgi:methanogenic corrinoid protein MtbC1